VKLVEDELISEGHKVKDATFFSTAFTSIADLN